MEQRGDELDLGGSGGEVILEDDLALVQPTLPGGALLTGDPVPEITLSYVDFKIGFIYSLPEHQVHGTVRILHGSGDEPEGMIFPPGFSLFGQAGLSDSGHV